MPPPCERWTSQSYGGYSISRQILSTTLCPQRGAHGAKISIQISALAGVWTSDLLLGSLERNR